MHNKIIPIFKLRLLSVFISLFFCTEAINAQDCANIDDFTTVCVGSSVTFPAQTTGTPAETTNPGNDYGCLGSTPTPSWFFFKVDTGGSLIINETNDNNKDVDGALWGPFDSLDDITTQCGSYPSPIACDYTGSSTFSFNIQAVANKYYVLLVTNFSHAPTNITLADGGSAATTICSPDIHIKKTVDDSTVNESDNITWVITAENKGVLAASNLVITDVLPAGVTYTSHTGGTYNSVTGEWNVGNLASGSMETLTIVTTLNTGTAGSTITNSITDVVFSEQPEANFHTDVLSSEIKVYPLAPTVSSPIIYCPNATAAPLTATGTSLLWYTSLTGGVGTSTAPTPSTTTQGTTSYFVSQTAGNGLEGIRSQINIIVNDTTDPITPTLANVTVDCNGTLISPTTTDACAGNITGTTTDTLSFVEGGSTTITWNFKDGNGNDI
ncbi:MAG: hypothetical protein COB98_11855, partial [Flavobacteriaceae bacterium]